MDLKDIRFPSSKEEMEAMVNSLRKAIPDGKLDQVAGGADDIQAKNTPVPWICPGCGATVMVREAQDAVKHMVQCPGNLYK